MRSDTTDGDGVAVPRSEVGRPVAFRRIFSGFLQGILLYGCVQAYQSGSWPATNVYAFWPLVMLCFFLPLMFVLSAGRLSWPQMGVWLAAAAAVCVGVGCYGAWRVSFMEGAPPPASAIGINFSFLSAVLLGAGFFIVQIFVLAGASCGRYIAPYAAYFETAWKTVVQILFSLFFLSALWAVLWVGAGLFSLLELAFFQEMITSLWFSVPVSVLAFSVGLHMTDVRPRIVHGIRSLLLVLLSWLLPVAVSVTGVFLVGVVLTGPGMLWASRSATAVLLGLVALLVILVNAAFQDGQAEDGVSRILRVCARVACVMLLPITALAIYALCLRVGQYGWTVSRIFAGACLLIASCYAGGYLLAALKRGSWLAKVAQINVLTALSVAALLLALITPVADPVRLSVADQVARLKSGKITADALYYLQTNGLRYGDTALHRLKDGMEGADTPEIRLGASKVLDGVAIDGPEPPLPLPPVTVQSLAADIAVYPAGSTLPAGFLAQSWSEDSRLPACLSIVGQKCNAYRLAVSGSGEPDILLESADERGGSAVVFARDQKGEWQAVGRFSPPFFCDNWSAALKEGRFRAVLPQYRDVEVSGMRLRMEAFDNDNRGCP